jgi:RNA polymerase sigma-70 factor (ECF subfamily)
MYVKAMFNIAVRMTGEKELAEDILQEAFVKAFSEIENLKNEKAFGGWLKRIVLNRCIDMMRKEKYIFQGLDTLSEQYHEIVEEIDESADPEMIHHMIKKLPEGARQILVMRALEGYKHAEIGEKLGISESTAKTQFFRAKQLLGEMIKNREYENGFGKISEGKKVEA